MASTVQEWTSSYFFPPHPPGTVAVSTVPEVAHRLWGCSANPSTTARALPVRLDVQNSENILTAAETISRGGIIAASSEKHCVFLADADNEEALIKLGNFSGRPSVVEETATLVCAPEWLSEHVDMENIQKKYGYANVLRFTQEVTVSGTDVLGLILPAGAASGAPAHLIRDGRIASVWKECQPIRDLFTYIRYFGRRAMMAVSATAVGIDKGSDMDKFSDKLKGTVALMLRDPLNQFAYSEATFVDFTEAKPELSGAGSASIVAHLSRWGVKSS